MNNNWLGVCPGCFAKITGESLFADGKLALCRRCDAFFAVSAAPAIPQIAERPEKRCNITLERCSDRLIVNVPPLRIWFAWIFVFGFVFFTAMAIAAILTPDESFSLTGKIAVGCMMCLIGFVMLSLVLILFFYHRSLIFDAERLKIEGRLFFLRFRKTIPRADIWGLRSNWAPTQVGTIFSFYLTYGKKAMEIMCRSQEEQQWVTSEINSFLNSTAAQRLCCSMCNRGVIDRSNNRHDPDVRKCLWCGTKFDRDEAARIGEAELQSPWRSQYDLLRPLDAPTRVEQDENELAIFFDKRGVQSNWEKFGILFLVLLVVSLVPEIVFLFHPLEEVWATSFAALVCSALLLGLFGGVAMLTFWASGSLHITREEICAERKFPFLKSKMFRSVRLPDAWAEQTAISDRIAGSFDCTVIGKYQFTLFNGNERCMLVKRRSAEEAQWLTGVINRFLARTNDEGPLIRVKCPACRNVLSLRDFRPGDTETLHCPVCCRDFPIRDGLDFPAKLVDADPLQRPRTARAVVQQDDENALVIDYQSPFKTQFGPVGQMLYRLFFLGILVLLGVMWVSCGGLGGLKLCQLFFQVFNPVKAVLLSILTIGCTTGWLVAYFLMFWGIVNVALTSWTLYIDNNTICLTTRAFFTTRQTVADRTDEVCAENVKRNSGFNWQKWLQIRYWLDAEPAWSRNHVQLTARPAIPFPYHNEEEREWLLRLINGFLQEKK